MSCLKRVISGGQTGIDRAGLEAARACNIETGGKAPDGFKTEVGKDLSLQTIYGMTAPEGGSYVERTIDNIRDSDGTLVFWAIQSAGTDGTINYCYSGRWNTASSERKTRDKKHSPPPTRPVFVVSYEHLQCLRGCYFRLDDLSSSILKFISENEIQTLNIAGHRGSRCPRGFISMVKEFLSTKVFPGTKAIGETEEQGEEVKMD